MYNKDSLRRAVQAPTFTDIQISALIRLFKMAPASNDRIRGITAQEAVMKGLIFVNEDGVLLDYVENNVFDFAKEFYGTDAYLFNQTFYKSFADTRDATPYTLLFDQVMHYFTTYGAEAMGVDIPTYVPLSQLDLPTQQYNTSFKLTVIRVASDAACIERIDKYLASLTAPAPWIVECVTALLAHATIATDDIRSFEIQVIKHRLDNTVPRNPVTQLRFIVLEITGETLIIKNRAMRTLIQSAASRTGNRACILFYKCGLEGLASIFLRFKPIFLAFKAHQDCAPLINKLRRAAEVYHKPLETDALQNLVNVEDVIVRKRIISKASNRDLIKVMNSLHSRLLNPDAPGVYAIRNGRTFVKEVSMNSHGQARNESLANAISTEIARRLTQHLADKVYYMPEYIEYAVPTTEKQMIGVIPYGTYVGYDTRWGDDVGDYSPLADFTVTEVKQIGFACELPAHMVERTPNDGLCGQDDEDRFGFSYKTLDAYISNGVEPPEYTKSVIDKMHKNSQWKREPMQKFDRKTMELS